MLNSIFLQSITLDELLSSIKEGVKNQLTDFKKELETQSAKDELMTRSEACDFLRVDESTIYHWTRKGKVKAYAIANRRYYKRSELIESIQLLKTKGNGTDI